MKIGDVVKFKAPVSGVLRSGRSVWMDTASVRGKRKTLLEIEIGRGDTRLVYADKLTKQKGDA